MHLSSCPVRLVWCVMYLFLCICIHIVHIVYMCAWCFVCVIGHCKSVAGTPPPLAGVVGLPSMCVSCVGAASHSWLAASRLENSRVAVWRLSARGYHLQRFCRPQSKKHQVLLEAIRAFTRTVGAFRKLNYCHNCGCGQRRRHITANKCL